jgi:hypothetical protein
MGMGIWCSRTDIDCAATSEHVPCREEARKLREGGGAGAAAADGADGEAAPAGGRGERGAVAAAVAARTMVDLESLSFNQGG